MQPFEQAHADQADEDEVDRYNEIEQPRHDQDQYSRNQGDDGRNMRSGDDHEKSSERFCGIESRAALYPLRRLRNRTLVAPMGSRRSRKLPKIAADMTTVFPEHCRGR